VCSVVQCGAVWCVCCSALQHVVECCSVVQCGAVCGSMLRCVGVWHVAVCCSVLQCGAACCSVLQRPVQCLKEAHVQFVFHAQYVHGVDPFTLYQPQMIQSQLLQLHILLCSASRTNQSRVPHAIAWCAVTYVHNILLSYLPYVSTDANTNVA